MARRLWKRIGGRNWFINPPAELIYPRVEKIQAIKPDDTPYEHDFTSGSSTPPFKGSARAYGLKAGSIHVGTGDVLITTRVLSDAVVADGDAEDKVQSNPKKPAPYQCQECGAGVRGRKCSKCGSYDIDIAPSRGMATGAGTPWRFPVPKNPKGGRRRGRRNPLGEMVTIVGGLNPPRHRRRAAVMARRRRHHRRHRRNPPSGGFAVLSPGTWLRPAMWAGGAAVVSAWAPSAIIGTGVSTTQAYGTQIAVALGLGFVANWWGGPRDAIPAFSGAVAPIVADFTRRAIGGITEKSVAATPASLQAYTSGRLGDLYYSRTFMPRRRVSAYPVAGPTAQAWVGR